MKVEYVLITAALLGASCERRSLVAPVAEIQPTDRVFTHNVIEADTNWLATNEVIIAAMPGDWKAVKTDDGRWGWQYPNGMVIDWAPGTRKPFASRYEMMAEAWEQWRFNEANITKWKQELETLRTNSPWKQAN